ncbi:UDP-glucosyltransferase 2-like isoform X1 [Galleria mellonella]|uniref:UDP-glucosyltransferase 2-like isoform X1 n=1 Tax=Galleria mellonella TaxID=7137 RepID=A0ABM3MZG4_GALME|nr:UDP-glucosyltransferase 2-like isoform X1 [Galleria mellonella]
MQDFAVYNAFMTFENKDVKALMEDPKQEFDLVIADLYETEIYAAFSALYNCPMIWSYSMGVHWQVLRLIDEPTNPAYTADYLSFNLPPFNFIVRLQELWAQIKWQWIKWYSTTPKEIYTYEKYFGPLIEKRGRTLPNYHELIYNASMILANDYNAFGNIPSTPQNFKLIGGYHIATHTQPLPKDLQSLMDSSTNGVIYFSMGSTLKSKDIPKPIVENILKIFGSLKQTVIWKFEEKLHNLPKNVHIMSWAPQPSILAHPKCLFFISHGGQLSSSESVHFGIPIIGIPIYMDQFVNVEKAVSRGYAIRVHFTRNLASDLKTAIDRMLNEPKYRQRAKELSAIYHDRPVSPGRELVHWVRHVASTRGAAHLRSPALHVPCYQKYYLDLIFLLTIVNITFFVVIKIIYKKCKSKKKEKKSN